MLDHFAECIKQAKGVRQQAVQLNIFTAVLSALKVKKLDSPELMTFKVRHMLFFSLTAGFG